MGVMREDKSKMHELKVEVRVKEGLKKKSRGISKERIGRCEIGKETRCPESGGETEERKTESALGGLR